MTSYYVNKEGYTKQVELNPLARLLFPRKRKCEKKEKKKSVVPKHVISLELQEEEYEKISITIKKKEEEEEEGEEEEAERKEEKKLAKNSDPKTLKLITCQGCLENQPNQMAHMDFGGCCYNECDFFDIL